MTSSHWSAFGLPGETVRRTPLSRISARPGQRVESRVDQPSQRRFRVQPADPGDVNTSGAPSACSRICG